MPVKLLNRVDANTNIGLWEITESEENLLSGISLSGEDKERLEGFRASARKKQWLAYRQLLSYMMGMPDLSLRYDAHGKPYIVDSDLQLSVAHSGDYAAVITCRKGPAGIDIERVSQRVSKVEDRFLSEMEKINPYDKDRIDKLCIYWCAKEALFKLHGRRELDFKKHLFIDHFDIGDNEIISGSIIKKDFKSHYQLHQLKIDDYYLVYVTGHME
jgi:phosphopantetheinyl transferase